MIYTYRTARPLLALTALTLALACNPDKGGDTGDSATEPTTGSTTEPTSSSGASSSSSDTGNTGEAQLCGDAPAFVASWATWEAAVAKQADYFYIIKSDSGFEEPSCGYRTTVIVDAGVVTGRRFEAVGVPQPGCEAPFIEAGEQVGTNAQPFAAAPVTIEALYTGCCDKVLHIAPSEEYDIHFEVDAAGLIQTCYALPMNCADGCDIGPLGSGGLTIESLQFGAPPPAP